MSSDRQIEANRRNAQRSTGPRTAHGKSRVAFNAVKHGLTGRQAVLPHEDSGQFDAFCKDVLNDLAPQGALEAALAEKIVVDLWRLRRIPSLENAMYTAGDEEELSAFELMRSLAQAALRAEREERQRDDDQKALGRAAPEPGHERPADAPTPADAAPEPQKEVSKLSGPATVTHRLHRHPGSFANLWRHEAALSRSWSKTLHELQRLQAIRAGERVPAPAAVDVDVSINGNGVVNPE